MSPEVGASPATPAAGQRARSLREVLNFLVVGGVGFIVDATILTGLTLYAAWSPWLARIPSFAVAVFVTWALNRRHTFPDRGLQHRSTEAFFYLAIQGGGALINLGIFWICLELQPQLVKVPVIALAFGSAGGLVFNYLLSSKWLYSRFRRQQ